MTSLFGIIIASNSGGCFNLFTGNFEKSIFIEIPVFFLFVQYVIAYLIYVFKRIPSIWQCGQTAPVSFPEEDAF